MTKDIFIGLMIPLLGTSLGSACVFFLKENLHINIQKALIGFASGVMVAASIWSLIIPSIEQSSNLNEFAFLPAIIGFWIGVLFLMSIDLITPHLHLNYKEPEGPKKQLNKTTLLTLAVVIHNIPEGMAIGVIYAAFLAHTTSLNAALILSIGIAIQNFPEGAIISMPLYMDNKNKKLSFLYGVLSGAVEPLAGFITILLATALISILPYCLSFAAGAMMYVVVEELVPEMAEGKHSHIGVLLFAFGFTLMMALDIFFG